MSVVTSINSLNSFEVTVWRLLLKVEGSEAPAVIHAFENPKAAVDACCMTASSCVVFVKSTRMLVESFFLMREVKPVTLAAYLDSATTLPIEDLNKARRCQRSVTTRWLLE